MNKLIILAYNEEAKISDTIKDLVDYFDEIIVVNDKSKDDTLKVLEGLKKNFNNIVIINNEKNFGPGRSMELAVKQSIKSRFDYLVKIDGDNQFDTQDILKILAIANAKKIDFIKCDRFWSKGIIGDIPKIRYFGNSLASLLIKFSTGNWKINDPLNGLFLFSYKLAMKFKLPKMFYRYGYPFYINAYISRLSVQENYKIFQFKNKITYSNEESNLNPFVLFIKLTFFSIYNFFKNIGVKLKYSNFQLSAILDLSAIVCFFISVSCFIMGISVRFFKYNGNQSAWILICIIFLVLFFMLVVQSQKNLKNENKKNFTYLN